MTKDAAGAGSDRARILDPARRGDPADFWVSYEKKSNACGLFDMHGNVQQWYADWFSAEYYKQSPPSDPTGPPAGYSRVLRGGLWNLIPSACRSALRYGSPPARHAYHIGFRVVVESQIGDRAGQTR